jgi:hypothetical protein
MVVDVVVVVSNNHSMIRGRGHNARIPWCEGVYRAGAQA